MIVYLFMGILWLGIGIWYLDFWGDASTMRDRLPIAGFCFVLAFYNLFRWRMARWQARTQQYPDEPPPRPRHIEQEPDPTFDFSDPKPDAEKEKKPPAS